MRVITLLIVVAITSGCGSNPQGAGEVDRCTDACAGFDECGPNTRVATCVNRCRSTLVDESNACVVAQTAAICCIVKEDPENTSADRPCSAQLVNSLWSAMFEECREFG